MQSPTHPIDETLQRYRWKRARLDDLGGETSKLAARIICRSFSPMPRTRPIMASIDVHLWLKEEKVHMELAYPEVPAFFLVLVAQGLKGVTPHGVGLTPCEHEPWHWNPFCLPLVWQEEMDSMPHFTAFAKRYSGILRDSSWQCPNAARLMR